MLFFVLFLVLTSSRLGFGYDLYLSTSNINYRKIHNKSYIKKQLQRDRRTSMYQFTTKIFILGLKCGDKSLLLDVFCPACYSEF
ncbi:UNVERIFIED_CONTAM: hypothetical protein NCL1_44470 [Trichonephila clavipes]